MKIIKLAKTRIKTGLILNEIGIKNNLKVNESEIQGGDTKTNKKYAWTRKNGFRIL